MSELKHELHDLKNKLNEIQKQVEKLERMTIMDDIAYDLWESQYTNNLYSTQAFNPSNLE